MNPASRDSRDRNIAVLIKSWCNPVGNSKRRNITIFREFNCSRSTSGIFQIRSLISRTSELSCSGTSHRLPSSSIAFCLVTAGLAQVGLLIDDQAGRIDSFKGAAVQTKQPQRLGSSTKCTWAWIAQTASALVFNSRKSEITTHRRESRQGTGCCVPL